MKKLFSILFSLVFSFTASAYTENNTNSPGGGSYVAESSSEAKELESNDETEPSEQQENGAEPDSSYYSVNKFNFLFYFVYKMNYMDDEDTTPSND